jgi:hypothetical protein
VLVIVIETARKKVASFDYEYDYEHEHEGSRGHAASKLCLGAENRCFATVDPVAKRKKWVIAGFLPVESRAAGG